MIEIKIHEQQNTPVDLQGLAELSSDYAKLRLVQRYLKQAEYYHAPVNLKITTSNGEKVTQTLFSVASKNNEERPSLAPTSSTVAETKKLEETTDPSVVSPKKSQPLHTKKKLKA